MKKKDNVNQRFPGLFSRKKGITMAIGTVVMLIISIVVFSMAIYLTFKWFAGAEELTAQIDKKTEDQIISALRSGNQLVTIPLSIQQANPGEGANFALGIRNVGGTKLFSIQMKFSRAYKLDGSPNDDVDADYMNDYWLGEFATVSPFSLKRNELKPIPLLVKVEPNVSELRPTQRGDYVFNVCVYTGMQATEQVECTKENYLANARAFYTEKMYQVTVRVV